MDAIYVAAALLSALLHAGWNAVVKASPRPTETMAAQMLMSAVIVLPCLLWSGLPAKESWVWIVCSTTLAIITITSLLRAFELGGFGLVYPLVRAVSVVLVVPLAAFLAGDALSSGTIGGIAMIVSALVLLGLSRGPDSKFTVKALGWTLIAGMATAAYVMCDGYGVRRAGSPWAYGFVVSITNAIAMYWRQRHVGTPWHLLRANWLIATPVAMASVASYALILWVWSSAPIAPASALRDTSAVFAILIAIVWLKEPFRTIQILAVLLAAAAIPLLRLA